MSTNSKQIEFERVSPATIVDLAECFVSGSRYEWEILRYQLMAGDSWAIRVKTGENLIVGGFMPTGTEAEAWMVFAPLAKKHMLPVIRAVRLTLAESAYCRIYVVVLSREGRKIARLTGFHAVGKYNNSELWEWAA